MLGRALRFAAPLRALRPVAVPRWYSRTATCASGEEGDEVAPRLIKFADGSGEAFFGVFATEGAAALQLVSI